MCRVIERKISGQDDPYRLWWGEAAHTSPAGMCGVNCGKIFDFCGKKRKSLDPTGL
jgi:hypothetical protein